MTSRHWERDRKNRRVLIETIGEGNVIKTVVVDRHHKNGPEIHEISDTGIITIFNQRTRKMITQLIARPGQIKRYFTDNEVIPNGLLELARNHQRLNYNYAQISRKAYFYAGPGQIAQEKDLVFVQFYFKKNIDKPAKVRYNIIKIKVNKT